MHQAAASRVERLERGIALFDDDRPLLWDLNLLWIDASADASARDLVADAERVQGAAQLGHRRVVVGQEADWRPLVGAFADAGYELEVHVFLAHRRPADRLVDTARVEETGVAELAPAMERYFASEPWGRDPETRRQLLEHNVTYAGTVRERCFVVRGAGGIVAYCKLWSAGGTAQIEDVVVLAEARGRGLGRAVVTGALNTALALEPELTFIVADDGDWPKLLYAKLGFEPIGRMGLFTRRRV